MATVIAGFKSEEMMWKYLGVIHDPKLKNYKLLFVFHNKISETGEIILLVRNNKINKFQFISTTEDEVVADDFSLFDSLDNIKFPEFKSLFHTEKWYKKYSVEIENSFSLKESKFISLLKNA